MPRYGIEFDSGPLRSDDELFFVVSQMLTRMNGCSPMKKIEFTGKGRAVVTCEKAKFVFADDGGAILCEASGETEDLIKYCIYMAQAWTLISNRPCKAKKLDGGPKAPKP